MSFHDRYKSGSENRRTHQRKLFDSSSDTVDWYARGMLTIIALGVGYLVVSVGSGSVPQISELDRRVFMDLSRDHRTIESYVANLEPTIRIWCGDS